MNISRRSMLAGGFGAAAFLSIRGARAAGLNIDYFPTNFIVRDGLLWYIDYECNAYMEEWNYSNWGVKYWSRTEAFEAYLKAHKEEA